MAEKIFKDSSFRFTDPIRFFKANDPYYFEVDNIPLKQLQENCLWLKDQIQKVTLGDGISNVSRSDFSELKPYASGGDRKVRVKPGRYTARINDVSTKLPLAFLEKLTGDVLGEVDSYKTATPLEFGGNFINNANFVLNQTLNRFKTNVIGNSTGMTGLAERAFTWPVYDPQTPVNSTGLLVDDNSQGFFYSADNNPGSQAFFTVPIISHALLWAKSSENYSSFLLEKYGSSANLGMVDLPNVESYFIKAWRGVSRLAVVDVDSELSIEVPPFDSNDFNYIDENGNEVPVDGVQSRIDLVFIYSSPIDSDSVNILKPSGKTTITAPTLGIVRGAGIKISDKPLTGIELKNYQLTTDNHKILANPADALNEDLGFTSTSDNDIAYDMRGSFPSPDDLLNIAPLISEKLESTAYELVGQSILPVAYVFVQNTSLSVAPEDVVDIRPFFRTAELTYNERAGISAAFPQLSLANPAIGKAEMQYELKRINDDLKTKIQTLTELIEGGTGGGTGGGIGATTAAVPRTFETPFKIFTNKTYSELGTENSPINYFILGTQAPFNPVNSKFAEDLAAIQNELDYGLLTYKNYGGGFFRLEVDYTGLENNSVSPVDIYMATADPTLTYLEFGQSVPKVDYRKVGCGGRKAFADLRDFKTIDSFYFPLGHAQNPLNISYLARIQMYMKDSSGGIVDPNINKIKFSLYLDGIMELRNIT